MKPSLDGQTRISLQLGPEESAFTRQLVKDEAAHERSPDTSVRPSINASNGKRKRELSTTNGNQRKSSLIPNAHEFHIDHNQGYSEHVCRLRDGVELRANGETIYSVKHDRPKALDCIYLVSEPPGEPYYLGRIMEFTKFEIRSADLDAVRINWFYRPRDIQRQNADSRLLFATMHSDISPLSAIRGKCTVLHKSQISDVDRYRKQPNCFYFERLFDKFMRRQYEVIPVQLVTNVPNQVKNVLLNRWKYVVVEPNRSKELSMEHRSCRSCSRWCSSKDSVRCAICESDFHMQCVSPPLPRKPTRGFVWSCTPCSTAEVLRLQDLENAENSVTIDHDSSVTEELAKTVQEMHKPSRHEDLERIDEPNLPSNRPELWPFRYLGVHCNVNDAVDYDDRIYPRAASRIGQRHQAAVQDWPGRPVEYFEKIKRPIKRTAKAMKGRRSEERAALESPRSTNDRLSVFTTSVEAEADLEKTLQVDPASLSVSERPLWLQEKPANYVARGEGSTAECRWVPSDLASEAVLQEYLSVVRVTAERLSIDWRSPDLLDTAMNYLYTAEYDVARAAKELRNLRRESVANPCFSDQELLRFEESVHRNGSELAQVAQDVGSKTTAECIRFYYIWKKTTRGAKVWARSEARRPKTGSLDGPAETRDTAEASDKLEDSSDDSAYNIIKAAKVKKTFRCKFCETTSSPRWRKAPGISEGRNPITALCQRCAMLWRHYAVAWERPEETYRKVHEGSHKGRRKKFEEELLKELPADGARPDRARDDPSDSIKSIKKVRKLDNTKTVHAVTPIIISCSVCLADAKEDYLRCATCSMTVHEACYGWQTCQVDDPWLCDTCRNSVNPLYSMDYHCILCSSSAASQSASPAALKRTTDSNWAHVSCAMWNPLLSFGDTSRLEPINGISTIPIHHWEAVCQICKIHRGLCTSCAICGSSFHVECALHAKYKVGFDLQVVKSSQSRRDGLSLVRIGAAGGLLNPVIICSAHTDTTHSMHFPNESTGENEETVLTLYARVYKSGLQSHIGDAISSTSTPALRRRVSYAPSMLRTRHEELGGFVVQGGDYADLGVTLSQHCDICHIETSPCFYRRSDLQGELSIGVTKVVCHRCHWQIMYAGSSRETSNGIDSASAVPST